MSHLEIARSVRDNTTYHAGIHARHTSSVQVDRFGAPVQMLLVGMTPVFVRRPTGVASALLLEFSGAVNTTPQPNESLARLHEPPEGVWPKQQPCLSADAVDFPCTLLTEAASRLGYRTFTRVQTEVHRTRAHVDEMNADAVPCEGGDQ